MNNKEKTDISKIVKHVNVLNKEVGKIQVELKWIRAILIALFVALIINKFLL